jgi:hypothetical protein
MPVVGAGRWGCCTFLLYRVWSLTLKRQPTEGPVGVQLELLVLVTSPATMLLSCDFSVRWFASFGGADRRLPEQGRNRR